MLTAQVEEGISRIKAWVSKFLQEREMDNLVKGAKMIAADPDG